MEFNDVITMVDSRKDLEKYKENALLLWALQIRYQIEDVDEFASSALTDGGDDKKCDLVWVNRDEGFAIIAQGYVKQDINKAKGAPANKASDLNTAVAWALGNEPIDQIPERIRSAISDLREAIESGEVSQLLLMYLHNLPESPNVEEELRQVKTTAERYIAGKSVEIFVNEVGQESLIDWYESLQNPILVTDQFQLPLDEGRFMSGDEWRSFNTNVSGKTLAEWFKQYGKKLFSANHRDYLGSRNSDKNINNGIKESAEVEPGNFWVYNNGISVITNGLEEDRDSNTVSISGISIINGAQTTGSLGSVDHDLDAHLQVGCRFIECSNQEIIKNIVKNNNLQNKLISSDFRSNDRYQKRLIEEFEALTGEDLVYTGGRRGGASDAIARRPNLLSSDTVAQSLTAFHGRPDIGYKFKSRIWEENEDYKRVFNDKTTAKHILFVYSLFKEILEVKSSLTKKEKSGETLTEKERESLEFFNARGSVFVLIYGISKSIEILLERTVDDKFELAFKDAGSLEDLQANWNPIIQIAISFSKQLLRGVENYSLTMDNIEEAMNDFTSLLQAVAEPNRPQIGEFSEAVA